MRPLTASTLALAATATVLLLPLGCQQEPQAVTVEFKPAAADLLEDTVNQRWLDVADQPYAQKFRRAYDYSQARVTVTYLPQCSVLRGRVVARNLKPNFAYRLGLLGLPLSPGNEPIGLTGRWRQEVWDGKGWREAPPLDDKGSGLGRNPADKVYFERVDVRSPTSPTAYAYRFTGQRLFDWFLTSGDGNADVEFVVENSWRGLCRVSQRAPELSDGAVRTFNIPPATASQSAYGRDEPARTVGVYPEWERRSLEPILLPPGLYLCRLILVEESFHGQGDLAGRSAVALSAEMDFRIVDR